MSQSKKDLIDRGFDSPLSPERIERLCELFGSEDLLQELVWSIHEEDGALDMKRGEFYPEILRSIRTMKQAAARAYDVEPGQVHPNFGCNGCIDAILMGMKLREVKRGIDPSREGGMLVATPTYFRNYNSSEAKRIRMIKVPLRRPDYTFDLGAMLEGLEERRPTVVFLVTPNNPTGMAIPDQDIVAVLDAAPPDTLVVMDRTLVNIGQEISTRELIHRYADRQLAILHSLSKYAGLSHLRVGFALYSNLKVAKEMRNHLPLGLGVEGAVKASRVLARGPLCPNPRILNNVRESKRILEEFCRRSGRYRCTDFVGNYCLLTLPAETSRDTTEFLEKNGIFVMGGHDLPETQPDVLRIHTGGRPELMARTVDALSSLT